MNIIAQLKIDQINNKITDCNNAITAITNVKSTCTSQITSWKTAYNTINNNSDLLNVKKSDTFEGDMADRLKTYMSDLMSDIDSGISSAGDLENALDSQITTLSDKVTELNSDLTFWQGQLLVD